MFSILDQAASPAERLSRREWLRVGGLSALGVTLPHLLLAGETPAPRPTATPRLAGDLGSTFGRAKNVIVLWLQGGPPQHETFDPKPDAPVEIRGEFKPIATNVPGIQFCELLPRTARYADRMAVVRTMSTDSNNHDVSGYWLLTGYPSGPGSALQIKPTDWPYMGSVVKMLRPSNRLPALTSVWIPDWLRENENIKPAGQTAGFLGSAWDPERFVGDPAAPDYQVEGLRLAGDVTAARVDHRRDLLARLDGLRATAGQDRSVEAWDRHSRNALDLVTSGTARAAFDLSKEPDRTRDRYGRHTWGQSVLLARRLIEAGVRLVHVNWSRDPGDAAVDNPMWDTHAQNSDRLQDSLCPQFDISFAALMDDLTDRGLLDETLVVVTGEFGRTPRINKLGGRDHWGHVFSFAMAGAGIRGGQVVGASDRNGAFPATDPVRGGDLTATVFHLLGIDPNGTFLDKMNRPHPLTKGEPIVSVLGDEPATPARCQPGGDPAFVPPYDASLLLDTDFRADLPLLPSAPTSRQKGWRAFPIWTTEAAGLAVRKETAALRIGYGLGDGKAGAVVEARSRALLAQEIRNARGGHYTFTVRAAGEGSSAEEFEKAFLASVTCHLVLFRFRDTKKDARTVDELASAEFRPAFGKTELFRVDRFLGSAIPGTNFPIGNGLGVGVVVETKPAGPVARPKEGPHRVALRIESVTLDFSPRLRDENVTQ
ncbi:MAG TPA: DUF1501 domain-containing protein [Gemmataceae bacterium]|nr:DUF1501 domain-containing protein [Gemmataceae bacterium]